MFHQRRSTSLRSFGVGLLYAFLLSLTPISFAKSQQDEATPDQLEKLKRNISQISHWLDKANSKKSQIAATLKRQEINIAGLDKNLQSLRRQINATQKELKQLSQQQFQLKLQLKKQQKLLSDQINAAYQLGSQPALKMLLNNNVPQDIARGLAYYDYLNEARRDEIDSFKSTLKKLQQIQTNINSQQARLAKSRLQASKQKQTLEKQLKARRQTITRLNSSIHSNTQKLEQLKQQRAQIEKILKEVEQAIVNLRLPDENQPFSKLKSKLPWPTRGKVTTRFGSRVAQGKLRYNGLFIKTANNAPVQAVHYGRVVFSDWIRGLGLLLILDHGGGYMTLYGNNRSLLKATGDWVSAGEVIAYSGSSGGNDKTGLYFEIRKKGKPINPRYWLSRKK